MEWVEKIELKSKGEEIWRQLNSHNRMLIQIKLALDGKESFNGTRDEMEKLRSDVEIEIIALLKQSKSITDTLKIPFYDYHKNPNPHDHFLK